jgi:tape measure domain-containing protein
MASNDIEMKITADSRGVVTGLEPMMQSLANAQKASQETATALAAIDSETTKISVEDEAIQNARKEIDRLRGSIVEDLRTDINADTKPALKRIGELQRTIKTLDKMDPVVDVAVDVDTSQLSELRLLLTEFAASTSGGGLDALKALPGLLKRAGTAGGVAVVGLGAAAVGIGAIGIASGLAAADIETLTVQLDALSEGRGVEALTFLQGWAKSTPFELDQATEATKRLVAAGVELDEIPSYLDDIGSVAAATGVPLDQIATVFAQMEGKGKATFEEMQQLAEAGVPVWQTMAEALGMTVAEVQELATNGKLTADAVTLLRQELGKAYPTAMADMADTLQGKLSSLQDTFTQTWQALGSLSLPALKTGTDMLQDFADIIQDFVRIYVWAGDQVQKLPFFDVIALGLDNAMKAIDFLVGSLDTVADTVTGVDDDASSLGDTFEDSMVTAEQAVEQAAASLEKLSKAAEDALEATIKAFAGIGGTRRLTVDFIISKDDLIEDIRSTIQGINEKGTDNDVPPVELPANLNLNQISNLGDKQQELVSQISGFVQQGLDEGARRAEIVPGFDEDAWYRQVRQETRGLLIEAGVDTKEINRVLTNVFGLPRDVPVGADISQAEKDVKGLGQLVTIPLSFPAADAAMSVPIAPVAEDAATAEVNAELEDLAEPDGVAREATIIPMVDPLGLALVRSVFAELTATETKLINVVTQGGVDPTGALRSAAPSVLAGPSQNGGGGGGGGGGTQGPVRIAPRQTPVAVYLDGTEIAHRIEARRDAARSESVRRMA